MYVDLIGIYLYYLLETICYRKRTDMAFAPITSQGLIIQKDLKLWNISVSIAINYSVIEMIKKTRRELCSI